MKRNPNDLLRLFIALCCFFPAFAAAGASEVFRYRVELPENVYLRVPGQTEFSLYKSGDTICPNSLITVKPLAKDSLATDAAILIGSHSLTLLPGSTLRILADGIYPLLGRFEINSETASEPLMIVSRRFTGGYGSGKLLIEATPDNGVFVAMRNKGDAWFKDSYRKIFQLQAGQQLHFPLFGETLQKEGLDGFWAFQPAGFGLLRPHAGDLPPVDSEEDSDNATDTEDLKEPAPGSAGEEDEGVVENGSTE